jgi:ribosome recycling factor
LEAEVQKVTNQATSKIDDLADAKRKEITEG